MATAIDLTGKRFGELTALEVIPELATRHTRSWLCRCDCGETKIVTQVNLSSGGTTTCGKHRSAAFRAKQSLARKGRINLATRKFPIGSDSKSRLRHIWDTMIQRCRNPNSQKYKWYGARGIDISEDWKEFADFREWALSSGYQETLTIDRIDNNKGYSPNNCRWATMREQSNNRRSNSLLTAFGETKSAAEWLRDARCKISQSVLSNRIARGWGHEAAISTPPKG